MKILNNYKINNEEKKQNTHTKNSEQKNQLSMQFIVNFHPSNMNNICNYNTLKVMKQKRHVSAGRI